ncbi:MAG: hypothetical protein HC798_02145 [Polaribacter sp.]|nr:hypothetical protein [Polaribacter sp.]
MKQLQTIFILLFFFLTCQFFAQKTDLRKEIDSLKLLLNKASEREKVELYQQLFFSYRGFNLDSAEIFANKSLQLAIKLNETKKLDLHICIWALCNLIELEIMSH